MSFEKLVLKTVTWFPISSCSDRVAVYGPVYNWPGCEPHCGEKPGRCEDRGLNDVVILMSGMFRSRHLGKNSYHGKNCLSVKSGRAMLPSPLSQLRSLTFRLGMLI